MNKRDYGSRSISSVQIAVMLCTLAALGGRAAQAQATAVTTLGQLGNTNQTATYPLGDPGTRLVQNSFIVAAGSNSLTFTATGVVATPVAAFQSQIDDATQAPQFTPGSVLEETGITSLNAPTGPLRIDFANGVTGFGLYAQDFDADFETFTLTVFNGNTPLSAVPFTFGPVDNTSSAGTAVFVGALSNSGPLITSAVLSSTSSLAANASNDFYFGPAQVSAPVPEASTAVGFGMGLFLFASLTFGAYRRKASGAPQSGLRSVPPAIS